MRESLSGSPASGWQESAPPSPQSDLLREPAPLPPAASSRPRRRPSAYAYSPGLFGDIAPTPDAPALSNPEPEAENTAWREELNQRLANVRQRRQQKQPKFPSLQLPLEGADAPAAPDAAAAEPRPVPRMYRAVMEAEAAAAEPGLTIQSVDEPVDEPVLSPAESVAEPLPVEPVAVAESPVDEPRIWMDSEELPTTAAAEAPAPLAISLDESVEVPGSDSATVAAPELKVIAFPKLSPYRPADHELAESLAPRADLRGSAMPRILDADAEAEPVVPPLPPALGGLTLDSPRRSEAAREGERIEVPITAAPLPWRGLAEAVDLALASAATALFGSTGFFAATRSAQALGHTITIPNGRFAFGLATVTFILVWFTYKFVALVFTGSTPGLRVMGLELLQFQGGLADRRHRTRRAWASLLSLLPAGLGYLWCFLDEDFLGWHDRITQTYTAVGGEKPQPLPGVE